MSKFYRDFLTALIILREVVRRSYDLWRGVNGRSIKAVTHATDGPCVARRLSLQRTNDAFDLQGWIQVFWRGGR